MLFHECVNIPREGEGGTRKNFDRGAHVTFLGLKFNKLLSFWVAQK